MSEQDQQNKPAMTWKTRIYVVGGLIGATMGFLSAYLFAKEAEDDADNKDEAPDIPASALLGLVLSAVTLMRQIAETGRKKRKK